MNTAFLSQIYRFSRFIVDLKTTLYACTRLLYVMFLDLRVTLSYKMAANLLDAFLAFLGIEIATTNL